MNGVLQEAPKPALNGKSPIKSIPPHSNSATAVGLNGHHLNESNLENTESQEDSLHHQGTNSTPATEGRQVSTSIYHIGLFI